MNKVSVSVVLDLEADRDILRWLDRQGNKSEAIRAAIRAHIGGGVTLASVYQAVRDLERRIEAGAVVVSGTGETDPGDDEPSEAARALDALAAMG